MRIFAATTRQGVSDLNSQLTVGEEKKKFSRGRCAVRQPLLAAGDRMVRLWDAATDTHRQTLETSKTITRISFSDDSRHLKNKSEIFQHLHYRGRAGAAGGGRGAGRGRGGI